MAALRDDARTIFTKALEASVIETAFARKLSTPEIDGVRHLAFLHPHEDTSQSHAIALEPLRHVRIVAAGKAASEMLRALLQRLPLSSSCTLEGVLIARDRPADLPADFQFFPGGHPMPTEGSFAGARAALDLFTAIASSTEPTLCLSLISGGASAMMELPLEPAISLKDTVAFYHALVHSGASITEINCVRKHFSAIKGGRLALAAGPQPCLSLLVSDVPPGHLDALASGPTLPDSSTVEQCHQILDRYRLLDDLPASVRSFFQSPHLPETPKAADLHAPAWTMLDSADFTDAAEAAARTLGYRTVVDNTCDDWDYKDAAAFLLQRLRDLRREHTGERLCLLSTGEVTVEVSSQKGGAADGKKPHGTGGRNQQIALYLAMLLKPSDAPIAILSAGSDGIDGNSDAAGAVLDDATLGSDRALAEESLAGFDTNTLLQQHGATVVTGPTGNNLRDLRILLTV